MLKQIKEYFKKCPLLEGSKINVNYLAEKALSYSIEAEPGERTIKNYVDGGELRQKVFLFASREEFDYDPKGNEDIAKFYEELSAWIDENNKKRCVSHRRQINFRPCGRKTPFKNHFAPNGRSH